MHAEFTPSSTEITLEEQYQAAGWVATINVLKDLAEKDKRETLDPSLQQWIGERALRLGAICLNDTANFVPVLERWYQGRINKKITHLPDSMAIPRFFHNNGSINTSLQSAHVLAYSRDTVSQDLSHECDFERLESSTYLCQEFNMNQVQNYYERKHYLGFGGALLQVRRDSAFYIGMYDQPDS